MSPNPYHAIARNAAFRRFWLGITISAFGDALTRVALTWYVYEQTQSAAALGWLMACYTGPVVGGGLVAGWLLDRFDRRRVMAADNIVRGLAVAALPLLHALGVLALWHVYAVAAAYGFLMMISLAGGPALIPALVARDQLETANALETLSFTLAGVAGPVLAGLLIAPLGVPNLLWIDVLSYFAFAWALSSLAPAGPVARPQSVASVGLRLQDAGRLLLTQPVLLTTTAMFMMFNLGAGGLSVWLPILVHQVLGGGPELYGALLAAGGAGEVVSAVATGGRLFRAPLGTLICLAQLLAGAALALMLIGSEAAIALAALVLFGVFSAPLTIWAQTLRMAIIPEPLRGRTFALLRMLMQSGGPLGSALAGLALPALGLPALMAVSVLTISLPGWLGFQVRALRAAGNGPAAETDPWPASTPGAGGEREVEAPSADA